MSHKVNKKSASIDLPKSLRGDQCNHRYNLRPRKNRVNYCEMQAKSTHLTIPPLKFRPLQIDLSGASSSKKSKRSFKDHYDPQEIVTHFVNVDFNKNRESLPEVIPSPNNENDNESDSQSKSSIDASVSAGTNSKTVIENLEDAGSEESIDNFQNQAAPSEQENDSNAEDTISVGSNENQVLESDPNSSDVEEQSIAETNSEQEFNVSDDDETNEVSEYERNPETEENFRHNYSASAFDYQELVGNSTMYNLARWASQSGIRNEIEPADNIRDFDASAMGDGRHNRPNVLELSFSILHEEYETDRESEF